MNRLTAFTQRLAPAWAIKSGLLALVIIALVASLATAVDSAQGSDRDQGNAPQIEGSWFQTVEQEGGPTKALLSFCPGSALVATVNFPGWRQTGFHGTWVRKGGREFTWTSFSFGYDVSGAHAFTVRVHEELTLAPDGQSYGGHAKVDLLDPEGNLITELPPATTHGRRINAE